jgi:hypothetical protein
MYAAIANGCSVALRIPWRRNKRREATWLNGHAIQICAMYTLAHGGDFPDASSAPRCLRFTTCVRVRQSDRGAGRRPPEAQICLKRKFT